MIGPVATRKALRTELPISSSVSTWGEEVCFGTPVSVPRVVRPGPARSGPVRPGYPNRPIRVERA
ncbi:hypothetical protein [Kitasatospora sp. NPDC088779]|uniref:hypothetical protein n=1 Tax=Kitasatospora sp. NPDC088779 TaxID=3154964 RepID=UPI00343CCFFA